MSPVGLSKVSPPQLTNTLPRPRLLNLLKKHMDRKLILILGQGAQGKSTLAAAFLKQVPVPSAWANLGPEDSDPVNLFHGVVHSLQRALQDCDLSPALDFPTRTMGFRDPVGFYREWIRGLSEFLSSPVFLVLDGLDRLSADSLSFPFLQILVEESPPELHLVMSSRQAPPDAFNYQSLKLKQQVLVLNNEDLAFNRTEIRDFFRRTRGIALAAEHVDKILQATEGWAGGLILMAEILGRDPSLGPERFLRDGFLNRYRVEAFEYLGKEIFDNQPPAVQDMLIRAALIPQVDPALLRGLTGDLETEGVLREFARRNLFVQGVYESGKGWVFRFHHLFREFLLNRFRERFNEEERNSLYRKAARLHEDRGELETAVRLSLEAGDSAAAADVIRRIGLGLCDHGRTKDLSGFLEALPPEMIQSDPWLLLLFCLTRRWTELPQNAGRLKQALNLFEGTRDVRGVLTCLSYLLEAFFYARTGWRDYEQHFQKAEQWFSDPVAQGLSYEKALVLAQIGIAHHLRGNLRRSLASFQAAYALAESAKNTMLEARILLHQLSALAALGELAAAERMHEPLLKITDNVGSAELQAWHRIVLSVFHSYKGDFEQALAAIEGARTIIKDNGLYYLNIVLLIYEVFCRALEGDLAATENRAKELAFFTEMSGSRFAEGTRLNLLSLAYLKAGRFDEAWGYNARALEILETDEGHSEIHLQGCRLKAGLIAFQLGRKTEALQRLKEVLPYFEKIDHFFYETQVHLGLGMVLADQGRASQSRDHLQASFRIGREKGLNHFFFFRTQDVVRACLLVFEFEVTEACDLAREMLTGRYAEAAETELAKLDRHPAPRMRELGLDLLRAIHRRRVPFLEIKTFGGLELTRGEDRVGEEAWERLQPKRLLTAILARPGGKVAKEVLIEDLWPEERPGKGENNFKVTLMRLRKFLEPAIHPEFGSSYLHLRNNLVILNPEFTHTDVDEFLAAVAQGNWKERTREARGAMEKYEQALAIYRGDFLPEETGLTVVDRRRDDLKGVYIETLQRLAKLSEEQGLLKKAGGYYRRVLEAEPLQEEACQGILRLSLTLGNTNEALRAFDALARALGQELQSQPDQRTLALCKQVREKLKQS
jgi:ATP/maltotriose-dependent transcriptional regulator MalT